MARQKKRLSAKAIRRLRNVQARILEEPLRVHMDVGIARRGPLGEAREMRGGMVGIDVPAWPPCNTVGCIAGHLCLAARRLPRHWYQQEDYAAGLIGAAVGRDGPRLFHAEFWPQSLRTRLLRHKAGTMAYAQVIAAAIDAWIAGDGSFDAPA